MQYWFANFQTGEVIAVEAISEKEAKRQLVKTFGKEHIAGFEGSFNSLEQLQNAKNNDKKEMAKMVSQGLFTIQIIRIEYENNDVQFIDSYGRQQRRKIRYTRSGRPFIKYAGMKWYLDKLL